MNEKERSDELRALARELFEQGARMMRLKPQRDVRDSVRGLPAVMRTLALADGPLSPGELARTCEISDARVANILRVLEERGYIERRAVEGDRRRVNVHVTELGREVETRHYEEGQRFVAGFLEEFGVEDSRELVRLLTKMNDVVERRRAEGRDVPPDVCDGEVVA